MWRGVVCVMNCGLNAHNFVGRFSSFEATRKFSLRDLILDFHWISTTSRAESDRSPLAPAGRIFGHLLKLYVSVKMLESNASVK